MEIQILASTSNFVRRMTFWRSFEWFANVSHQADLDGLQWEVQALSLSRLQTMLGWISKKAKASIVTLKQGYRGERWPLSGLFDPNQKHKKLAFVSWFAFPHKMATLNGLARLQRLLKRPMWITVYPDSQGNSQQHFRRTRMVQLTAQNLEKDLHVNSIQEALTRLRRKRWYVDLDIYHMLRDPGFLSNWEETIDVLFKRIKLVSVSLGRESLGPLVDSPSELLRVLNHDHECLTLKVLTYLIEVKGYHGPIVLKIKPNNFGSVQQTIHVHNKIAGIIRTIGGAQ